MVRYGIGSAKMLALMVMLSLASNLGFVVVCLAFASLGTYEALLFQAQGFWPILMGLIVIECMDSPESHRRLFFWPTPIPTKLYPVALFAIFSLFTGFKLDMAISMAVGYFYHKGYLMSFTPQPATVQRWERGCLANFTTRPQYITQTSAQGMTYGSNAAPAISQNGGGGGASMGSLWPGGAGRSSGGRGDIEQAVPMQGGGSGTTEAFPAFPGGGQTLGSSDRRQVGPARETAREARLARLAPNHGRSPATATPHFRWKSELEKLEAMGYSSADSMAALEATQGNLNTAVNHLAGF